MGEAVREIESKEYRNSEKVSGETKQVSKGEKPTVIPNDEFHARHLGPSDGECGEMLKLLGYSSLDALTDTALPDAIKYKGTFHSTVFPVPVSEQDALARIQGHAKKNNLQRSYIGMGYYDTVTPTIIARNILENPGWYTQYTPYQPEISQGRLEALLNYQTVIADLTGLPIVNASLLDEGTAAAEAMSVAYGVRNKKSKGEVKKFFVSDRVHPQSVAVLQTRSEAVGIEIVLGDAESFTPNDEFFGALIQYPTSDGAVLSNDSFVEECHKADLLVVVAADLLALTLLRSPGSFGADIVVGSAQRFGVPLGYGGPHAAFFATRDEYKRIIPGRLVGVSRDSAGNSALRLALQTREQHIRREKATSNICTAQVLLAIMAGMYAVYHGPNGLKKIASKVHSLTAHLAKLLKENGVKLVSDNFFDTLTLELDVEAQKKVLSRAKSADLLLRYYSDGRVGVSLDECSTEKEIYALFEVLTGLKSTATYSDGASGIDKAHLRSDEILTAAVFNSYQSETEFLRYIKRLEGRDLSLAHSMIPLGSCTMKLNATSEMLPVSYPEFSRIHPFAPLSDTTGYQDLFRELEIALEEITGFDAVSLQPNAGSQGEYAGLLAIRRYHQAAGDTKRDICLIPTSAHGTNPASAVMAGQRVVVVKCDENGNVDIDDLRAKATEHKDSLSSLMVTYPSTHGVFEEAIKEICEIIHENGGLVYLDGANLNALVGLSRPAEFGADVCHINLHKTFCIPHGGGGPGMGPIGVNAKLAPFLPGHPFRVSPRHLSSPELRQDATPGKGVATMPGEGEYTGAVSAAPWGSSSILPISWMYMAMMGASGMRKATQVAILNANYIAKRLADHYPVLYRGQADLVAHECILDLRDLKDLAGVEAADIAKRLMDYGFHAPTMSWPVPGTLMIEPTESESKAELDRFIEAMIAIREEITKIEKGEWTREDNPLKNAPHTALKVTESEWSHPYTRETAAFPTSWTKSSKFWPAVARIEESYGDRNLICTCPSIEDYA